MAGVGGAPSSVAGQEQGKGERRSWRQTQCQQCGYWGWHAPWHPEHKAKYCNYCLFWWNWEEQEKRRLELQEWQRGQHTQGQQWMHHLCGRDGKCLYGPLATGQMSDEQKTNFEAWADAQPLAPGPSSPN